eukprot:1288376-Pleurochrysis_carterae.AAC.2
MELGCTLLHRVLCMARTKDLPLSTPSVARSTCCCPANSASSAGCSDACALGGAPHTPSLHGDTSLTRVQGAYQGTW